jgi:hypothetical protein
MANPESFGISTAAKRTTAALSSAHGAVSTLSKNRHQVCFCYTALRQPIGGNLQARPINQYRDRSGCNLTRSDIEAANLRVPPAVDMEPVTGAKCFQTRNVAR